MSKRGQIPQIRDARERPRKAGLHTWKRTAQSCRGHDEQGVQPHARKRPALTARAAGGAYRDRTDDLKLAKLALSQLS